MKTRRLLEVDVFGLKPLAGNGLAVVLDGDGLTEERMQAFARWTNFSETTFVQAPTDARADYRLRIFTPTQELPFAGHPSIGTAFAMRWRGGLNPRQRALMQECRAGLMPLRVLGSGAGSEVMVRAPDPKIARIGDMESAALCEALGLPPLTVHHVNVGAKWLVIDLKRAAAVLRLKPDFNALKRLSRDGGATGVTVFGVYDKRNDDQFEVRSFAPADGIDEDPVCGSGNAAVAALLKQGARSPDFAHTYCARQGRACARDGRVRVEIHANGAIEIGGTAALISEGQVRL